MVVAFLAIGALVGWSMAHVLTPTKDPETAIAFTDVAVAAGRVESSIDLNVVASWGKVPAGVNRANGVVTEVGAGAKEVARQGSVVYRVNQRPIVVAEGTVPAYRTISSGSAGADVQQLQRMLTSLGVYAGTADGKAGNGTVVAIRAWQASLGLKSTGVVGVEDVIFVQHLPARITVNPSAIARGALVSGGEPAISVLSAAPSFRLTVSADQAALVPEGTPVDIKAPDGATWKAAASAQAPDAKTGDLVVQLNGRAGESICGSECDQVPVSGGAQLSATVLTVAPMSGLAVPSAALQASSGGQVFVISTAGRRIPVVVKASARGMSIIEGVPRGTRVRVPAVDSGAVGP